MTVDGPTLRAFERVRARTSAAIEGADPEAAVDGVPGLDPEGAMALWAGMDLDGAQTMQALTDLVDRNIDAIVAAPADFAGSIMLAMVQTAAMFGWELAQETSDGPLAVGQWAEVKAEFDIPEVLRPDGKATRGRVGEILEDGGLVMLWVPIGGADVDEHSQAVPYPPEQLERVDGP